MLSAAVLVLCGVFVSAVTNDLCLNKTEYDFYIMGNLVKDFEKRIQLLKENVNGKIYSLRIIYICILYFMLNSERGLLYVKIYLFQFIIYMILYIDIT